MDSYYATHVHDYSPARIEPVIPEIRRLALSCNSLLDIGCGTGNVMQRLSESLGIACPVGVESSANLVRVAAERTGFPIIQASVLDADFAERVGRKFDIVLMASVLHHLVGWTRRGSFRHIDTALNNAAQVVAPGGLLVISEPLFTPGYISGAAFYVKLLMSKIVNRRILIGGNWINVGPPVVSYLTPKQMRSLVARPDFYCENRIEVPRSLRLAGMKRYDAALIIRCNPTMPTC